MVDTYPIKTEMEVRTHLFRTSGVTQALTPHGINGGDVILAIVLDIGEALSPVEGLPRRGPGPGLHCTGNTFEFLLRRGWRARG
jgi:hypothetical protein